MALTLVIDTCVLVDMLISTRPRHERARRLRKEIVERGAVILVPSFAMFELSHALRQDLKLNSGKFAISYGLGPENGLDLEFVPTDVEFVRSSLALELPELRAGDLVFAALAKGRNLTLVTEDKALSLGSREVGINCLSIKECLVSVFGVDA